MIINEELTELATTDESVNIGVEQDSTPEWKRKPSRPLRYLAIGMTRTVPKKIGRNDPCKCGSGVKYKNCCLNTELAEND